MQISLYKQPYTGLFLSRPVHLLQIGLALKACTSPVALSSVCSLPSLSQM